MGISLYLFQLGSRRQLDFDLDARGTQVLHNLNRLAQTEQESKRTVVPAPAAGGRRRAEQPVTPRGGE